MMRNAAAILAAVALMCVMHGVIARPEPDYTALSARQEALAEEVAAPLFCHGMDCPVFTVVNTTMLYETRDYENSTWVSTQIETVSPSIAMTVGLKRISKYLKGANADNLTMPETAPVRVFVNSSGCPYCLVNITVSYFVPLSFEGAPPAPNSTDLYLEDLPAFTAFVATKGGYIFDGWRMSKMAEALAAAVAADGYNVTSTAYTFAAYDPPYQFFARHNEVWIEKA